MHFVFNTLPFHQVINTSKDLLKLRMWILWRLMVKRLSAQYTAYNIHKLTCYSMYFQSLFSLQIIANQIEHNWFRFERGLSIDKIGIDRELNLRHVLIRWHSKLFVIIIIFMKLKPQFVYTNKHQALVKNDWDKKFDFVI